MSVLGRGRAGRIRASSIASERRSADSNPFSVRVDGLGRMVENNRPMHSVSGVAEDAATYYFLAVCAVFGGGGVALTSLAHHSWSSKSTNDGRPTP